LPSAFKTYVSILSYKSNILTLIDLHSKLGVTWDPVFHRLRCNGHIINLSAQAFLFPDLRDINDEAELKAAITGDLEPFNKKQMEFWRKKGPLGKIHNIVVYIQISSQRIAAFKGLPNTNGLGLLRDNSTRWNSWCRMLERAFQLRKAIDMYCFTNKPALDNDTLTDEDWDNLEKLKKFLEYYIDATQATEGRFATLDLILPTMDFLLEQLEAGREDPQYTRDQFIYPCIDAGWNKLEKYYNLTGRSCAFTAAVVCCPQFKWQYFTEAAEWPEDWVEITRKEVSEYWKKEYRNITIPELPPNIPETEDGPRKRENSFRKWQKQKRVTPAIQDEYEQYINSPLLDVDEKFDPRTWWLEPTQRRTYPNLSKMALDLLSIPAMSAEVERLFSSCKITITDRRNQIGIDTVEGIECLKSWMRKENISFADGDVKHMAAFLESI